MRCSRSTTTFSGAFFAFGGAFFAFSGFDERTFMLLLDHDPLTSNPP